MVDTGPAADRMRVGRGARATERLLLADVDRLLAETEPTRLARRPLRLVVPSASLRTHLLHRLAVEISRPLLGVVCHTLFGVAQQILAATDRTSDSTPGLLGLVVRRAAAQERSLYRDLSRLPDGLGIAIGTVRDLLDAGFEPAHAEAVDEVLEVEGPGVAHRVELERARALLRAAAQTAEDLDDLGFESPASRFREAARLLHSDPQSLPATAVFVHGFADATGSASDLLEALLASTESRLFLDLPDDPSDPEKPDPGVLFVRPLAERLAGALPSPAATENGDDAPRIDIFSANGHTAEAAEVAARIRGLLDAGEAPESIGIVGRTSALQFGILRRALFRSAIPFSGASAEELASPSARRLAALADLLQQREELPIERWLEALGPHRFGLPTDDLLNGFYARGARRLADARRLREGDGSRRPSRSVVRTGFSPTEENGLRLSRRRLDPGRWREAVDAATRLDSLFSDWQAVRAAGDHSQSLQRLIRDELGWSPQDLGCIALERRVESALRRGMAGGWELDLDELALLVREIGVGLGRAAGGGAGGGVQCLELTEARSRTFEHLFVVGLNRGIFPRSVQEDPLFPDSLRRLIAREGHGVLPDLPIKRRGFDEERYLFAQLLSASPRVTLSYLVNDDDDRPLAPSPLLERLRWGSTERQEWIEPPSARSLLAIASEAALSAVPDEFGLPIEDWATGLGLEGRRASLAALLPLVYAEGRSALADLPTPAVEEVDGRSASQWSRGRLALLDELDPPLGRANVPGPFLGWIGRARDDDPRLVNPLFVTTLERLTVCPWQTLLVRVLRLQPLPDPLAEIPRASGRLAGSLVHRVLDRIIVDAGGDSGVDLDAALARPPVTVPWPNARQIERLLAEEARRLVAEEGILLGGFADCLIEIARPRLESAARLEWRTAVDVLGAEVHGRVDVALGDDRRHTVHFRADRVDGDLTGTRLTDYKTGRAPSPQGPGALLESALDEARRGETLQGAAYARAAGAAGLGRYLFLRAPDDEHGPGLEVVLPGGSPEVSAAFEEGATRAVRSWLAGEFFPRLSEATADREPQLCSFCEVRQACLRGDTSARRRLREWAGGLEAAEVAEAERSALELWMQRRLKPAEDRSDGDGGAA